MMSEGIDQLSVHKDNWRTFGEYGRILRKDALTQEIEGIVDPRSTLVSQ